MIGRMDANGPSSDEVELAWQALIDSCCRQEPKTRTERNLAPIVTAAHSSDALRKLYPYTVLDRLCFSVRGPSPDVDWPATAGNGHGTYWVLSSGRPNFELILATEDLLEAVDALVNRLTGQTGRAT